MGCKATKTGVLRKWPVCASIYILLFGVLKGSLITKALTCMKIYLYKQKWQFCQKTDTSGYVVV